MKTIKIKKVNGIMTPEEPIKDLGFGTMSNGEVFMIFESQEEADENTPVIEEIDEKSIAEHEFLNNVRALSEEGKAELKELLSK